MASSLWAEWIENGTFICRADGDPTFLYPIIRTVEKSEIIITWENNNVIYSQKISQNGDALWDESCVSICDSWGDRRFPMLAPDGSGGAIVSWEDARWGNSDIYIQRVDAAGNVVWTDDGVAVCRFDEDQVAADIVSDNNGGAIIYWIDYRNENMDAYAQRVDSLGNMLWNENGIAISSGIGEQRAFWLYNLPGTDDWIFIVKDNRNGNDDIYAQKISGNGDLLWTEYGVEICVAGGNQWCPMAAPSNDTAMAVSWFDERNGNIDIYAQKFSGNGEILWLPNGVQVCVNHYAQSIPYTVDDGEGGIIVSWEDLRSGNWDVYAQRIDSAGNACWIDNGVPVTSGVWNQIYSKAISDGYGNSIIVWSDSRWNSTDLYAQKIDSDGNPLWIEEGIEICRIDGQQGRSYLAPDNSGGLYIAWVDRREGHYDIYMSKVDVYGNVPPNSTYLNEYDVSVNDNGITLRWSLSILCDAQFDIYKAIGIDGAFKEILNPDINRSNNTYIFIDNNCELGIIYRYLVAINDKDNQNILFETDLVTIPISQLTIYQNYPNPFNPVTTIRYYLPQKSLASLRIYDASGKQITALVNREQERGFHTANWGGIDQHDNSVASGVYIYRLTAGKEMISRKMILLR